MTLLQFILATHHKDFNPNDYAGLWYALARFVVWCRKQRTSRFRWVGGENGHEV